MKCITSQYLAGNCGLTRSRHVVVVVDRVEPGDDDRDADDGLGGGVEVGSRHGHLCAAAVSWHVQNINRRDIN